MLNIDLLYILINIILLYIFCRMGWYVTQGLSYKSAAGVCITTFTLVLGSRYMRGNDYAHYVDVFNNRTEAGQRLFTFLNDSLAFCGFNAFSAYFVYALIFSCCLFYFLRRYKEYSSFTFPLSLIALIIFHESMIRQALSFSFIFLFIDQLYYLEPSHINTIHEEENQEYPNALQQKDDQATSVLIEDLPNEETTTPLWIHLFACLLFVTCSISIHTANIIVIALIILFWITLKERTIPYYISIPLILLGALVLNKVLNHNLLVPYLKLLQGTDAKFDSYIEDSNYWFGEDGVSSNYTRDGIILFCELWGYAVLFWLSDKMSKEFHFSSIFAVYTNLLIVGSFIMMTFRELEILNRMGFVISLFWFIPLSICLYHLRDFRFKLWEKIALLGTTWWLYEYLKYLFMRKDGMTLFLWDMNL